MKKHSCQVNGVSRERAEGKHCLPDLTYATLHICTEICQFISSVAYFYIRSHCCERRLSSVTVRCLQLRDHKSCYPKSYLLQALMASMVNLCISCDNTNMTSVSTHIALLILKWQFSQQNDDFRSPGSVIRLGEKL